MDMVFIKTLRDLGQMPAAADAVVIPLNPRAALEMAENGLDGRHLPMSFLDKDQRQRVFQEAIDLSRSWYGWVQEELTYEGIDLGDCCRLQMLAFFQDLLAAEMACLAMLKTLRPARAFFLRPPQVASVDRSMHDGTADIFEAVAQWRLQQAGIPVQVRDASAGQPEVEPPSQNGADVTQAAPHRIGLADVPRGKPLAVAFGSFSDLFLLWPYLKVLARKTGALPLLLNEQPFLKGDTARSGLLEDASMPFLFVNEIEPDKAMPPAIGQAREKCLAALTHGSGLPDILQNPLLGFQFGKLFDTYLPGVIRGIRRARYFFTHFDVTLYLDDFCAGHIHRAWTLTARQHGIPTATIPHGLGVNLVEFFDFKADHALAWGELSKRNLELASPERKGAILVSGSPVFSQARETSRPNPPAVKEILLITGGFLQQVWTDFDLDLFLTTWEEMFTHIRERPHLRFTIKPHPSARDFAGWYASRAEALALPNLKVVTHGRIEDIIGRFGLSILIGKPGTAAFISLQHQVPVIYLDGLLNRAVIGYAPWKDILPVEHAVKGLFRRIDQLASNPLQYGSLVAECPALARDLCEDFAPERVLPRLDSRRPVPCMAEKSKTHGE